MARNKQLDIGFIFGLFTTLLVTWIYLLDSIIDLGIKDPVNDYLFPLSILHYVIFTYILSSFLLLFGYGLRYSDFQASTNPWFSSIIKANTNFLLKFWFPVLFISALSFAFALIANKTFIVVPTLLIVATLIGILLLLFGKGITFLFNSLKPIPLVLLFIGYFLYIPIISFITAGVEVKSNNEYYSSKDTAIISIERRGYIFLPRITNVVFNNDTLFKLNSPATFKLDLRKYPAVDFQNQSYIEVSFFPQILEIEKNKYSYMKIAN